MKNEEVSDHPMAVKMLQLANLAFLDYVGARCLLLNEHLLPGASLASTAVEKYIKSILFTSGARIRGHLQNSHLASLNSYKPDLYKRISPEFLTFLMNCYQLRYMDSIPENFNLVIYARETLAELDQTIFWLSRGTTFRRTGKQAPTMLERAIARNDSKVLLENYLLLSIPKAKFLSRQDRGYAMRNRPDDGILEAEYEVYESPIDGKFCREGFIKEGERRYRIDNRRIITNKRLQSDASSRL